MPNAKHPPIYKAFVVRLRDSNSYLPARWHRRAGFSYDIPIEGGGKFGPRIFPSRKSAKNAITAWAQGEWVQEMSTSGWEYPETDVVTAPRAPKIPRDAKKLEIIPIHIREVSYA